MSEVTEGTAKRRGRPPRTTPKVESPAVIEPKVEAVREIFVAERPAMRPTIRDDDPRAAAARRAAQIRGHLGDMDEGTDEFRAPKPPDGWEYEWKRKTVLGQEDPAYQVQLARMGWEPVPTSYHPEMMPGMGNFPNIERKGQSLMMRPAVISDEARAIERRRAKDQIRAKEAQLNVAPDGHFERNEKSVRPNIKKGYSPIEVPND